MSKEKVKGKGKPLAFQFDSLESVHEGIQEGAPDPNVAAIEAHAAETGETMKAALETKDSKGTLFDASVHAVNADGEPSVTPTGKFRRKRGLSKVLTEAPEVQEQKDRAAARAAGQLAADLMIHSAIMLGGPEWNPVGVKDGELAAVEFNEHDNLRRAFADYFEVKNISDFPPGIALSIAISGYMVPRFAGGKETKTRVKAAKEWCGRQFAKLKRSKKDAAQSDTRDNGVGKDDTSETTSGPVDETKTRSPGSRSDV